MRKEQHFDFLAPIGSNVNEKLKNAHQKKKKKKKSENVVFSYVAISTLVQPQGKPLLKFERNLLNRF